MSISRNSDVNASAGCRVNTSSTGMRMPLNRVAKGSQGTVVKVSGADETKKHLNNLGFVEGTIVTVISELNGSIIVEVKGTKLGLDADLAKRVTVMS